LGLASALALPGPAAAQDFDPAGRRHRPSAPAAKPSSPGGAERARPPASRPAGPDASDEKAGPNAGVLIARYTAIVLAQPTSPFPLQRLAQLYRERDGNLKQLVADFEKRASAVGPEQWAARLVLGAIYRHDGRLDDATRAYESASEARPKDPGPTLALAQLARDKGDLATAAKYYQKALAVVPDQDRESTLRSLLTVSLDLKDFDGAKRFHRELVKHNTSSFLVRGELGRELEARGEHDRAEAEFREVVAAASGDNRTLAPALRDLGRVLARQHENAEALSTLKKALSTAGSEAGVRGEIFTLITDV
jgi:tetratricopeptide (TPR) repeat protein